MKIIVSSVILLLIMTINVENIGNASGFEAISSPDSSFEENKNVSPEQNISAFSKGTFQSKHTVKQGQMTFFLNKALTLPAGQVNGVTNSAMNLAAYESIIDNKAMNRATRYIDGRSYPDDQNIVHDKQYPSSIKGLLEQSLKSTPSMPNMTVKFLDVGQGDAIYIEYPNGKTTLIDAGRHDTIIDSALKAENITHIDTFIGTHPDADHIGGAAYVINNYKVTKVIDSGQTNNTLAYSDYLKAIEKTGVPVETAAIGHNISDDENVSAQVLYVDHAATETNDGSIVIMLTYGLTDILLTADAEVAVEKYLINHYNLNAEILKVAHHGANTGTSRSFIKAVNPAIAILQYGFNLFGLPHAEVVNDLLSSRATLYSTFNGGTITINTDGKGYSIGRESHKDTVRSTETSNQLQITAKDLDGEIVTIKNIGQMPVNLTGWILLSVKGKQTFVFPDGFILNGSESVNITSGPNAVDDPPLSLKWTHSYIWNQKGDPAKLYDPFGKLIQQLK